MIVTGAMLAESASVADNKLDVRGGVVDTYRIGPDRVIPVTLVVLTQTQPFDKAPTVNLTITTPGGGSTEHDFDVPESSLGGEIGFVVAPLRISAPSDGRYVLSVRAQSGLVALPLTVFS
ncbi:hypothetical protein [Mycolicibacterium hippocampi]|uniref:Uncharacterized protein n=1 Tax=Mycolicibacterium hippocampi TaxID=659824 RepID=A0A850PS14_9MYCO|nr:hypothetical protein [Mycolicibacterium hippocampi]